MNEPKETVFEHTPVLRRILESHGKETLREYLKNNPNKTNIASDRKAELLAEFGALATELFGKEVSDDAVAQLSEEYFVSTADHHGPVFHPFFLNGNLLRGVSAAERGFKNILVLSCANVSLNNSSFPRGLLYTKNESLSHLPIFSLKFKHVPVYSQRAYNRHEAEMLKDKAEILGESLGKVLGGVYGSESVLAAKNYSEQVSRTNFDLWKLLPLQQNVNLIYITQEELASRLIVKHHLGGGGEIYSLLTDSRVQDDFERFFDGIPGAFGPEGKGTVLFWAVINGERKPLSRKGGKFVSQDGYAISIEAEKISEALQKGELMPSMALSFIVLSFYYGVNCGGGFSQVSYLSRMKDAYVKLIGGGARSEEVASIVTDYFSGEFALNMDSPYQMTAMDMLLSDKIEMEKLLRKNYESMTLSESLDMMMPEFYKIITGKPYG